MKLKNLFIFHSVVALVNGGSLVLAPKFYLGIYGISLSSDTEIFLAQLLGAALLTYCIVSWYAKDAEASVARSAIVIGFFTTLTIGSIIALMGQLSGLMNGLGWGIVVLYILLAFGYGYFQFVKPETA